MSWRTIVIKSHAKLNYKNDYLLVRSDDVKMIHLSEINTIIIDSTQVSLTSYLLCELIKRKIKVIFCDEKRNPSSELVPYYGNFHTSKNIEEQIHWNTDFARLVWTQIIRQKIENQAILLEKLEYDTSEKLREYITELKYFDETNREGHAAKVYFNSLFGKGFSRDDVNNINAALNYGYAILLSSFNKEIVSNGYLTQLGIKHTNEYNAFNLSCDLMEPFRVIVDEFVYQNMELEVTPELKMQLVDLLNKKVCYCGKEYFLTNAIQMYVKKVFETLRKVNLENLALYVFQ